jgi:hypothetical protein
VRLATLVAGAPCSLGLAWMRSAVRAPSQVSPRDPSPAEPHQQRRNLDETLRLGRLAVRQIRLHVHTQLEFSGVVGIRERPRGSQPLGETQLVRASRPEEAWGSPCAARCSAHGRDSSGVSPGLKQGQAALGGERGAAE